MAFSTRQLEVLDIRTALEEGCQRCALVPGLTGIWKLGLVGSGINGRVQIVVSQVLQQVHEVVGRACHGLAVGTVAEVLPPKRASRLILHVVLAGNLPKGGHPRVGILLAVNDCNS